MKISFLSMELMINNNSVVGLGEYFLMNSRQFLTISFVIVIGLTPLSLTAAEDISSPSAIQSLTRIADIQIHGNTITPTPAILATIPFRKGEVFEEYRSRQTIINMYKELKRFKNITIKTESISENEVIIHIVVEEKYPLKRIIFKNNKGVTEKAIKEKYHSTFLLLMKVIWHFFSSN